MRSRAAVLAGAAALAGGAGGCWLVSSLGDLPVAGDASTEGGQSRDAGDAAADRKPGRDARADGGSDADGGMPDGPGPPDHGGPGDGAVAEAGGPSLCADSGFLFCDGFENGLDAWSSYGKGGGAVAIDNSFAFRGTSSVHVSLPAVGDASTGAPLQAVLYRLQGRGSASSPLYERVFAYFPGHPLPSTSLLTLDAPADAGAVGYMRGDSGDIALLTYDTPGAHSVPSSNPMPTSSWVCLEMRVDGTTADFWVDGEATSLSIALPLTSLMVDMQLSISYSKPVAGASVYDAWYDEFVANGTRIGCER